LIDERKILDPFDKGECISLKEAAGIAGKSESTLRAWVEEHGLGRRIGEGPGPLAVSRWRCFSMAMKGHCERITRAITAVACIDLLPARRL